MSSFRIGPAQPAGHRLLEPGSTYKVFIVASALDGNAVKPTDRYPL